MKSDAVAVLISKITSARARGDRAILVLMDMTGAYDNVNISKLYDKLNNYNVPHDICRLTRILFQSRKLFVRDPTDKSLIGAVNCSGLTFFCLMCMLTLSKNASQ